MHVPARLGAAGFIAAITIEPHAGAAFAFDPKIIALEELASIISPPLHGDAFGAFGTNNLMPYLTPSETDGRTVRHLIDDFDDLRPLEQPDRPRQAKRVLFYGR